MRSTLLFALILFYGATASALTCQQYFNPAARSLLFSTPDEVENSQRVSEILMRSIRNKSLRVLRSLKSNSDVIYDVVILGAGPQAAAASLVLGQTSLKSLVVEKTNTVASNFAEKDFFINSVETPELSMHDFPGSHLRFSMFSSSKYASSLQLAAYIQAKQYMSKVPVLLNTEVVSYEVQQHDGKPLITLITAQGLKIKTRVFLGATGLGDPHTKIPTPAYQELFKRDLQKSLLNPFALQRVMNTETFMRAFHLDPKTRRKIYLPKTLVVIGNGDGQKISLEDLLEPFVVMPEGFRIFCIGKTAQTKEEYIASRNGGDRYVERIVQLYERNLITAVPGRAAGAELTAEGHLRFKVVDPETNKTTIVEGDMVVDATGYQNTLVEQLKTTLGPVVLKDVEGHLAERFSQNVTVARQITLEDGTELPIYLLGAAAGSLAKPEELQPLKNRNAVAMYNTVGRTSVFVSDLFNVPMYPRTLGERTQREGVLDAGEIISRVNSGN